jgi:hypothetical protein
LAVVAGGQNDQPADARYQCGPQSRIRMLILKVVFASDLVDFHGLPAPAVLIPAKLTQNEPMNFLFYNSFPKNVENSTPPPGKIQPPRRAFV